MNLDQIETKCYILSLFIRDDGERFLLGSRAYEFLDKQMHFVANTYQNDVVEVQGNDGWMLAGQVRRPNEQTFEGYVGGGTTEKTEVESLRTDFLRFFRKNHYYKVVYILPDGTAIQRRRGFITSAPEVQELYQMYPKYKVGLNFEDVNYYTYEEDGDGQEIYGKSVILTLTGTATGGLIWNEASSSVITAEGTSFTLSGTVAGAGLSEVEMKGGTFQQTYSGKNLFNFDNGTYTVIPNSSVVTTTQDTNSVVMTAAATGGAQFVYLDVELDTAKTYTVSGVAKKIVKGTNGQPHIAVTYVYSDNGSTWSPTQSGFANNNPTQGEEYPFSFQISGHKYYRIRFYNNRNTPVTVGEETTYYNIQLEVGSTATSYEPYTGGTASPNPDYPQEVQVVTGEQKIKVHGKNLSPSLANYVLNKNGSTVEYTFNDDGSLTVVSTVSGNGVYMTPANNRAICPELFQLGYTFSFDIIATTDGHIRTGENNTQTNFPVVAGEKSRISITNATGGQSVIFYAYPNTGGAMTFTIGNFQVETGSVATNYEPYAQSCPVNLGDIELCRIGTCQDRIYKENGSWFLFKATGKKTLDGSEDWAYSSYFYTTAISASSLGALGNSNVGLSNYFTFDAAQANDYGFKYGNAWFFQIRNKDYTTVADFKSWLDTNTPTFYYPLATPTATQITNEALIAQLDALASAKTYDGQTVFSVDGGGNLSAVLKVTVNVNNGGGVEWDADGAVWEDGGGGGANTVVTNSIDNIFPVITISGKTINPTISVLNTATTLSYNGTITASQTLAISTFEKTALLNGVNVTERIKGDWPYLEPGTNNISYTTENADAPSATLWYQEVVG